MTKICTKCRKKKPATLEYFPPDKRCRDGLDSWCRICSREVKKIYQQTEKGKEQRRRSMALYYSTVNGYLRNVYKCIKQRCNNPKNKGYKYYGGRGIKNKFNSSDEFVDYVINELQVDPRKLQIDRIDNDGNYERGNIRFVTAKENCSNRRYYDTNQTVLLRRI